MLRDDLLAPERDHEHRANVRMLAVRGKGVVSHSQVGTQLATARLMRQGRTDRRNGGGDPLGDHGGADDGRYDEHVIACADSTVGADEAAKRRRCAHQRGSSAGSSIASESGGSAMRASVVAAGRAGAPPPRAPARVWGWACLPGASGGGGP